MLRALSSFQERCVGPAGNTAHTYTLTPLKQAHTVRNTVIVLKEGGKREGESWSAGDGKQWCIWLPRGAWASQLPVVSPAGTSPLRDIPFRVQIPPQSLASSSCPVPSVHASIPHVRRTHAVTALIFKRDEQGKVWKSSKIFIRPTNVVGRTTKPESLWGTWSLEEQFACPKVVCFSPATSVDLTRNITSQHKLVLLLATAAKGQWWWVDSLDGKPI